jgi:branched-chain amino acid aminotransferase
MSANLSALKSVYSNYTSTCIQRGRVLQSFPFAEHTGELMPTYIRRLTTHGLEPVDYTAESLAAAAPYEAHDGIYTVTNTVQTTQVLKLDAHLDRMEDSARRADILLQLDRAHLRRALRAMILDAGFGDVRFRISVSKATPETYTITLEPFTPPHETLRQRGVRCITIPNAARANAAAKTTAWLHDRSHIQLPSGVYEALLLDATGNILEGMSSNFYAVLDGQLRTAGAGVLAGIAQQVVLDIAPSIVPVERTAAHHVDLPRMTEAFISSASRGIIPVVHIDEQQIGDGQRGSITQSLQTAYQTWAATHLQEL